MNWKQLFLRQNKKMTLLFKIYTVFTFGIKTSKLLKFGDWDNDWDNFVFLDWDNDWDNFKTKLSQSIKKHRFYSKKTTFWTGITYPSRYPGRLV
jgi:hypothetical protein